MASQDRHCLRETSANASCVESPGGSPPPVVGTFSLHFTGQEVDPQSNSTVLTQAKFLSVGPNVFVCTYTFKESTH